MFGTRKPERRADGPGLDVRSHRIIRIALIWTSTAVWTPIICLLVIWSCARWVVPVGLWPSRRSTTGVQTRRSCIWTLFGALVAAVLQKPG